MSTDPQLTLYFLIFSFNLGKFLQNCVQSITQCAPGSYITIRDDNSTDALTREVLTLFTQQAGLAIDVRQPALDKGGGRSKHGGLYNNLQNAWKSVPANSLICCIQDDMQLIRPLDAEEIASWKSLLDSGDHRGLFR